MFENKSLNIAVSIILAIFIWSFVMIEVNPQTTKTFSDIEVQYLNRNALEGKGLVVYDTGITTVDIILEGNSNDLNALTPEDISVTVDLFGRTEGENSIPVNVQLPEGVKAASVTPKNILVIVEKKVTRKKDVELSILGDIPNKYKLKSATIAPTTIEVIGPESVVSKLAKVVAEVDGSLITSENVTLASEIKTYNKDGKEIKGLILSHNTANATLEFAIEEEADKNIAKTLEYTSGDISTNNLSSELLATFEDKKISVTVEADREIIASMKKEDIILAVNLADLKEGTHTVEVKATSSLGLGEIILKPEKIKVSIGLKEGGE